MYPPYKQIINMCITNKNDFNHMKYNKYFNFST